MVCLFALTVNHLSFHCSCLVCDKYFTCRYGRLAERALRWWLVDSANNKKRFQDLVALLCMFFFLYLTRGLRTWLLGMCGRVGLSVREGLFLSLSEYRQIVILALWPGKQLLEKTKKQKRKHVLDWLHSVLYIHASSLPAVDWLTDWLID